MKLLSTCILSLSLIGLVTTVACSSEDSGGTTTESSYTCPAVGTKECPNDTPVDQKAHDGCNKCQAELAAVKKCAGPTKCGPDGKKEAIDANQCPNETGALLACALKK